MYECERKEEMRKPDGTTPEDVKSVEVGCRQGDKFAGLLCHTI